MSDRKRRYTWQFIDACCKKLASQIQTDHDVKHVIGISRGGLIPATIIAKQLGTREVLSLGVRSYDEGADYQTRQHVPEVYQDIKQCYQLVGTEPILIVDDISDQGNTFKFVKQHLNQMSASLNIVTASLFCKKDTEYVPDYVCMMPQQHEWVVFPWETDEESE